MARTHHYLRRMILGLMVVSGLGGCSVSDRLSITRDTPAPITEAPLRVSVEALPPSGEIAVREAMIYLQSPPDIRSPHYLS